MKTFDPNDPIWTAYLLNECPSDVKEHLERILEQDPVARHHLDELRQASLLLQKGFQEEPSIALDELQRARVVSQAAPVKRRSGHARNGLKAVAAVFVLFLVGGIVFISSLSELRGIFGAATEELGGDSGNTGIPMVGFVEALDGVGYDYEADAAKPRIEAPEGVTGGLRFFDVKNEREIALNEGLSMDPVLVTLPLEPLEGKVISPSQDDFAPIQFNAFRSVQDHPLSTFSIDVDTASYSVVRQFLNQGQLPPADAVRIEEMINYFDYAYPPPRDGNAFASHMAVSVCPWAPEHHLVRIALKGREIPKTERPPLNLVYLLDVSGSMNHPNKLPLVKKSMALLAEQLDERDRVAIVVYASAAGVVLPPTSGADNRAILSSLDRLSAGGSTAGGAGIQLAYKTAREHFAEDGVNRVILCTDGDFNVGVSQRGDLERLIEKEAESGIQLSVLGFGMGNYKDSSLEILSNKGNGNYGYIDSFQEARKLFVEQMLGTLVTIAKDVKIQVEFNPARVAGYRLVGYENRMLKKEDFNNDKVDAGDIGAGHTVTALYEIVPVGKPVPGNVPDVDPLKYQTSAKPVSAVEGEWLTLKLRHKQPGGEHSTKQEFPLRMDQVPEESQDPDFRFATAVAAFGFWLREPGFRQEMPLDLIVELAKTSRGEDELGYRAELIRLMQSVPVQR